MSELKTERLILRPITLNDSADIYDYSKNINVGINAGWKPHEDIEETKKIIKQLFLDVPNIFGIELKTTKKIIGTVGFLDDPKRENNKIKMLGYALSEDYWGQGIMTEAVNKVLTFGFESLNLDGVSCYLYPENERSKRVVSKVGFIYEGKLDNAEILFNGELKTHLCYLLTLEEYRKINL